MLSIEAHTSPTIYLIIIYNEEGLLWASFYFQKNTIY